MTVIEGTITAIMETWPLQLTVAAGGVNHAVTLTATTRIARCGSPVDPGALRQGQSVRIAGDSRPEGTMMARSIDVDG